MTDSGALFEDSDSVAIHFPDGPTYQPGVPQMLRLEVDDPMGVVFGFQLSARNSDNRQAGNLASLDASTSVNTAGGVQYLGHNITPNTEGTFDFEWLPPSTDVGTIMMYVAADADNGNLGRTGSRIHLKTIEVDPAAAAAPPPPTVPVVLSMGVVMGNLLPTINAISGESIISIFGRDFAPDGVDNRDTQLDPASGLIATNLSGVCVEIDGQRSPMFHVITEANPSDPTVDQVNVQAPTLMGAGPVSVVVISNCDMPNEQRSPAEPVQLSDRTPAFFLLEPILSLGLNPLVATHLDFSKIGDPNTHPGTTPAEPGEFIRMFGAGFGLTEPDVQAGEIPQNVPEVQDNNFLAPLVGDFTITIGGITLEGRPNVLAAGLSVCCAGLYEIVVEVPEGLPDGNHEVIATIDGVSTPAGTFITVKAP